MAADLTGRTAIVTGASAGIGRATALLAARRGAALVLVGRTAPPLEAVADAVVAAGGRAACVTGDAADRATAEAALVAARDRFGSVDILANVAGAFPTARLEDTGDAMFDEAVAANLRTAFVMCRTILPVMRERGGAIVNVSSTAARFPTPGLSVYGAAKAGVEALTRALAIEGAPAVRVNAVSAGPTLTDTVRTLMENDRTGAVAAVTAALPLGRLAEPDEIAEAILFLASPAAGAITGQVLHANCGGHMA